MISQADLILNPDGSIFHLHLKPEQISDTILLVGDPKRVYVIASFFSEIECEVTNREYVTITGKFKGKRLSVVSTGIGLGNVDIVMNELDALANVNFETLQIKKELKKLQLIRIGTSGALQEDVLVNSYVLSEYSIGLDNMMDFHFGMRSLYDVKELKESFQKHINSSVPSFNPYAIESSTSLRNLLASERIKEGITITSPGFYIPQNRQVRLRNIHTDFNKKISSFSFNEKKVLNYEMESAPIYAFSKLFGHEAVSVCLIIANRILGEANNDYRGEMQKLIEYVLNKIINENKL